MKHVVCPNDRGMDLFSCSASYNLFIIIIIIIVLIIRYSYFKNSRGAAAGNVCLGIIPIDFEDENDLIQLVACGYHSPSTENYPDLPAAHGPAQTAPPSSAGWQTGWADRKSGGWPPLTTPAASRTSRGPSSRPASTDTYAPKPKRRTVWQTACLLFGGGGFVRVCPHITWWKIRAWLM